MRVHSVSLVAGSAAILAAVLASSSLPAQDSSASGAVRPTRHHRWELSGLPALNFDADEGFGYGAVAELYDYAPAVKPYRFTVQPTLFLTTQGRRDVTVFFDAPALLPGGWRLSAYLGREQQLAQPYYGVGNETAYDPAAEQGTNPYFYRFGRTRMRISADLQHRLGQSSARLLMGAGASRTRIDPTPFDSGTTLLAQQNAGAAIPADRGNYLRAGVVWDTRDREIGARSGTWAELLGQRVSRAFGATEDYTRWTATARQYVPVTARLVFAQRIVAQQVDGNAPFQELATVQSSFKEQEGLGGASSIRGIPKDRYVGKGLLLSNSELRWRAAEFVALGRPSSLVVSGFVDAGRVWTDHFDASTALDQLHTGYGAGARLSLGQSFVIAVDVGHSAEATAPVYVGLGYLF